MIISNRIAALEESATLQVAALCQQLRAEGVDVIGLSLGEPDFPAPAHVKQAAIDAVNNDISHYGPTPGFPALRQAIAKLPERENMVIKLRYFHGMTQDRTAKVLKVSQVQVSRIEKKAIEHLRDLLK